MNAFTLVTRSPEETLALGSSIGTLLEPGDVIALNGPLGAGKTVLVKGIGRGLGLDPAEVTSPTFTLIQQYRGRLTLFHLDAYRLSGGSDLDALGVDELLFGDGATVIEWADRVADILPEARLDVQLEHVDEHTRRTAFRPLGLRATALLGALRASAARRQP